MAIKFSPKVGQILMCDFYGLRQPEMVKNRPVLVVGTKPDGHQLVTVVALSTVAPEKPQNYHMQLEDNQLPRNKFFSRGTTWVKADMIYTLSFERFNYVSLGVDNGKRVYFKNRLGRESMKKVYSCVLHGLHLGNLSDHL
ncbi:type II toxin-antitoxin system PemK/MazF family toxin [Vibrio splendidus]